MTRTFSFAVILTGLIVAGCDRDTDRRNDTRYNDEVRQPTPPPPTPPIDRTDTNRMPPAGTNGTEPGTVVPPTPGASAERDQFVSNLETRFDDLEQRVDRLRDNASGDAKTEVEDLDRRRQTAEGQLERIRTAGPGQWTTLRDDMEKSLNDLEQAIQQLETTATPPTDTTGSTPP